MTTRLGLESTYHVRQQVLPKFSNENQELLEYMESTWIRYVRVTLIFVTCYESHLESPSKNATRILKYYHFTRSWIVIITICVNLM